MSGAQTAVRAAAYPTQGRPLYNANFALNLLTFWEGTNDFRTAGLSVATVIEQTKDYARMVMRDGWSLQLLTPLRIVGAANNGKILEFSDWLLSPAARPYSTFPVLDAASDPRLVDPTNPTYWQADGVHPTPAGHAVLAELIHARICLL